jgi:hypothetical protein
MSTERARIQSERVRLELANSVHRDANVYHQTAREAWNRFHQTSGFFHPYRKARFRTEAEESSRSADQRSAAARALDPEFSSHL